MPARLSWSLAVLALCANSCSCNAAAQSRRDAYTGTAHSRQVRPYIHMKAALASLDHAAGGPAPLSRLGLPLDLSSSRLAHGDATHASGHVVYACHI